MSSPRASDLFAVARADAPDASSSASMWDRISLSVAAPTAAAVASTTTPPSTSAAPPPPAPPPAPMLGATSVSSVGVKLVAIGGAIGVGGTALGVVLALSLTGATSLSSADGVTEGRAPAKRVPALVAGGARLADPSPRERSSVDPASLPSASSSAPFASSAAAFGSKDEGGDLAEEARLVMAARAALVRGEPARALSLVHAAQKMPGHALEPEELGVEARALRALGRADEAAAAELTLKLRYPGHALAR